VWLKMAAAIRLLFKGIRLSVVLCGKILYRYNKAYLQFRLICDKLESTCYGGGRFLGIAIANLHIVINF